MHVRFTNGSIERAGALLDTIAEPENTLWPSDRWPPLVLDRGLEPGSLGGHGPVKYHVAEYEPGRRIAFAFNADSGLSGAHEFHLEDAGDRVRWTHVLTFDNPSLFLRFALVPLHDQLLEDLLDNAAATMAGRTAERRPMPPRTAALYRLESIPGPRTLMAGIRRRLQPVS